MTAEITPWTELETHLIKNNINPQSTLVHFRTAGPNVNPKAFELKKQGFKIINKPEVLQRTSDKFYSYEWAASNGTSLPQTKKGPRDEIRRYIPEFEKFVLKPINSVGMGTYCFSSHPNDPELEKKLSEVPGEEIIIQEYVPYKKIYRVIVIGGKALAKAIFSDEPTKDSWKVSVCINPNMHFEKNPSQELLEYAEKLSHIFESEIAFVDVFETEAGYVLSEINTACNLTLHEEMSGYNMADEIAQYLVSELKK